MKPSLPKMLYVERNQENEDVWFNAQPKKEKLAMVGDAVEVGVYILKKTVKLTTTVDVIEKPSKRRRR